MFMKYGNKVISLSLVGCIAKLVEIQIHSEPQIRPQSG